MPVSIIVDFSNLKLVFPDAIKPIPSNPADLFWAHQVNNLLLKSNNRKKAVYKVSANNNKKKIISWVVKKTHDYNNWETKQKWLSRLSAKAKKMTDYNKFRKKFCYECRYN